MGLYPLKGSEEYYLYQAWRNIKTRCNSIHHTSSNRYLCRNIKMDELWEGDYYSFQSWILMNIGHRPNPTYSIDRIKNDGGYFPGNIKWSTPKEQIANSKTIKLSEEDVLEVRFLSKKGYMNKDIALDYNVDRSTISKIKTKTRRL